MTVISTAEFLSRKQAVAFMVSAGMGYLPHMQTTGPRRKEGMNFSPEFESTVQHTIAGFLCVLPVVPLFLYVVVYCYMILSPLLIPLVKWRPQLRAQRVSEDEMREPLKQTA